MEQFKLDENNRIKQGFNPTDAYFEDFTERLMQELPARETRVIPLYKKARVWMSSAAAVLILALGLTFYFRSNSKTAQPDASAIESYLAYNTNISSYDIIQQLDQQDIDELEQSLSLNNVNPDAIEQYLNDQNVNVYE
ncbi:MAG: hypothetical protein ACO1N9_03095 [Flavobacterium sp.]